MLADFVSAWHKRAAFVLLGWTSVAFLSLTARCNAGEDSIGTISNELRDLALKEIQRALFEEPRFVKVHAADFLLALDYPQDVSAVFERELSEHGTEVPYRIGIWRVLARCSSDASQRDRWVEKLWEAGRVLPEQDSISAVESLAKLGFKPVISALAELRRMAASTQGAAQAYASWVVANTGDPSDLSALAGLLNATDRETRRCAAYALRFSASLPKTIVSQLADAAHREPMDSPGRVYFLSAALIQTKRIGDSGPWLKELLVYATAGNKDQKYEVCNALAEAGTIDEVPVLKTLLSDTEADVRIAAANAILRIDRRRAPSRMAVLDWLIIALYMGGMLAAGFYYSRQTGTTEDYLLGNRNLNPRAVGLSLFAALSSTVSFLGWPGEIIAYGPLLLCRLIAYPLIYLVAGWVLIPAIMSRRVTTAYEILEQQLGLSVRLAASLFFLLLRLSWMAVIVYATTSQILVPLIGIDPRMTPWICVALGAITVTYTSVGGLRAVVATEVIQSFILFGGAILTMVVVCGDVGIGGWLPKAWPAHWATAKWTEPFDGRMTFWAAMIGTFTWWICTLGSDQMAVQRYLATPNVKAARSVLATSLLVDAVVALFLTILGMGLLAYFARHPHAIPDGQTLAQNADGLFPQFIVTALPVGITGVVLAGLMATAMDSLSAGMNSTCSVVTVDFVDRFRRTRLSGVDHVRLAKFVSVLIGGAIVVLSSLMGSVEGNLIEVSYRVISLFIAPLFLLFFMALFVPWATATGTLGGAIGGSVVAVGIAYGKWFGLGFMWIMPASFVSGLVVGSLLSAVLVRRDGLPTVAKTQSGSSCP